jgi:uncharacterized caspase-like protein/membrane-associated protease RseP (regulator of RpoE activity)
MKFLVLDGSACRVSHSRVAVILFILVLLPCFSLVLFKSVSQAADDQAFKAVRRNSSDQRRVALVIGNGNYKAGPLQNPAHDAEDFSGVLRTLGFVVQTKTNVNQREMEEAVNRFIQEIQNGDVALFYFSGHGIQIRGENYLIPLGDSIQSEADVRYKTVNAGLVLAKMEESRNRANIVILDACRNNPFKGFFRSPGAGLSKMDAPKGTFIAYATSPDSVAADGTGRNSPYTKHLMEALKVKDLPIEQAFKLVARGVNRETAGQQTPWTLSSLLDDFYCNPSSPASSVVKPSDAGERADDREIARLREAQRVAALEKETLEREKREREREEELARLREAHRLAALEKERLEKEKQELLTRVSPSAKPEIKQGLLGVNIQDVTESLAKAFGRTDTNGALTAQVISGSPAERAGIKAGDIIVEFNNVTIKSAAELKNLVSKTEPDKSAKLKIFRDKKTLDVNVTMAERRYTPEAASTPTASSTPTQAIESPNPTPVARVSPQPVSEARRKSSAEETLGIQIENLTAYNAGQTGLKEGEGVLVKEVNPDHVGQKMGLKSGDVILEIDGKPINGISKFNNAVQRSIQNKLIRCKVARGAARIYVASPIGSSM